MGKSKNIRILIYLVAVAIVIGLIYFKQRTPEEKIIIQFSENVSKNLPMMMDEMTRLDKIIPIVGNILNYQFTILGVKADQMNKEAVKTAMTPYFIEDYQNNPAMKELRDIGTTIVYTYFDEDGVLVCEIRIDPKEFSLKDASAK